MTDGPRETATVERRSGLDRRQSNWRSATAAIPPDAYEALLLRAFARDVRAIVALDRDLVDLDDEMGGTRTRTLLDRIEIALHNLDEAVKTPRG